MLSAAGIISGLAAGRGKGGFYVLVLVAMPALAGAGVAVYDVWARDDLRRASSLLISALAACLTVGAFHVCRVSVAPGDPVVTGSIERPGDALRLPVSPGGRGILEVRARMDAKVKGAAVFSLEVGDQWIEGSLIKAHGTVRIGRHREHLASAEARATWPVNLPPAASTVRVHRLAGPIVGPVEFRIWRRLIPEYLAGSLALLGFTLAGLIQGVSKLRLFAPAVGCALGPASLLAEWIGPEPEVERALGALAVALIVSGFSPLLIALAVRRLRLRR